MGETMHGFTVAAIHPYETMNAQAVEFTHDKTGAKPIWIANQSHRPRLRRGLPHPRAR